jgi:hypothetical protein
MNDHDRPCLRRDERRQRRLVKVQRIRPDVAEDGPGAAQDECVNGGYERERRQNDFVARLNVEQQRGHLQRVRTRRRQEDGPGTGHLAEQFVSPLRE